MIVIEMYFGEDLEWGVQFTNRLQRPDFIQPKVIEGRTNSDQSCDNEYDDAKRSVKQGFGSAPGSQSINDNVFQISRSGLSMEPVVLAGEYLAVQEHL